MRLPSWHEFNEKLSEFEKKVSQKIEQFKNDHPLLDAAIKSLLPLFPAPFSSIAQNIYNCSDGSEEEKTQQVLNYFQYLRSQGEKHYNQIATQLDNILDKIDNLNEIVAKENTLETIKDILISSTSVVNQKMDLLDNQFKQIGQQVGKIEDGQIEELEIARAELEITKRTEKNTQQVLAEMKSNSFEEPISSLHLNLTGVKNREAVVGAIAHVQIIVDDQYIPFISFDNINNVLERALRGAGLFITGSSGSGKSRVLFEASKNADEMLVLGGKTTLEQKKSVAESAGGKASDVIDSTLIEAKKRAEDVHVLLWDNFPEGLVNRENLFSVKNALEMVASANNTIVIIALDPQFYAKYCDLAKEIASLTTVNVRYTKDEFGTVFRTIGKVYLGLDYERKIGANENKIVDILFAKWGLPKYIESFFALASKEDVNAVSLAETLGDKNYGDWAADQFRLLRERKVNLDFLYAIKLANLLGKDNV